MEKLKNKLTNVEGITLISLVVTIIILIILAGISISLMLGNDGILNRSKTASEEYNKQSATETINLKITNVQMSKYVEEQRMPTLEELAISLEKDNEIQYVNGSQRVASTSDINFTTATSIFTKLKAYPYEFEINSSLQLASIDGIRVATVPTNDDDTIVSMTMSELQSTINSAIDDKLKDLKGEVAYKMNHPNLWTVGVEQNFGDNLYGIRLQGVLTSRVQHGIYNFGYSANNSSVHIQAYGGSIVKTGNVEFALSNYYVNTPAQYGFGFQVNRGGYNSQGSVAGDLDLFCGSTTYGADANYDIWFLYTK